MVIKMNLNNIVNLDEMLKGIDIHPDFIEKYKIFLRVSNNEDTINNGLIAMMMVYLSYQNVIPQTYKKNKFSDDDLNENLKGMRTFIVRLFGCLDDYSRNNLYRFFYEKVYELLAKDPNSNVPSQTPLKTNWHKNLYPVSLYNKASLETFSSIIVITHSHKIYAEKIAKIIKDINIEFPEYKDKVEFICVNRDKESPLIVNKNYMKEAFKILRVLYDDENLIKDIEKDLKKSEDEGYINHLERIKVVKGDYKASEIKKVLNSNNWRKMFFSSLVSTELNWVTVTLNNIVKYGLFNLVDQKDLFEKYEQSVNKKMLSKGDMESYTLDIDIGLMINVLSAKSEGRVFNLDSNLFKSKDSLGNLKVLHNVIDYEIETLQELEKKREDGLIIDEKLFKDDIMLFKKNAIQNIVKDFLSEPILNFLDEVGVEYNLNYVKEKPILRIGVIDKENKYNNINLFNLIEKTILDKNLDLEKIEDIKEALLMLKELPQDRVRSFKTSIKKF